MGVLFSVRRSVDNDSPRRYVGGPFHAKPRPADQAGQQTFRAVDYDRGTAALLCDDRITLENN